MTRSKTFDNAGKREIGRQFSITVESPFLKIGVTLAILAYWEIFL